MASSTLQEKIAAAHETVGKNIQAERKAQNYTYQDLADVIGVSDKQIGKYIQADTRINAVYLKMIADKLKRPMDVFFDEYFIPSIMNDRLERDEKLLMFWYQKLPQSLKTNVLSDVMEKGENFLLQNK